MRHHLPVDGGALAVDVHEADALPTLAPPRRVLGVDRGGVVMTAPGAAAIVEELRAAR